MAREIYKSVIPLNLHLEIIFNKNSITSYYKNRYLSSFQKARDCSFIHEHEGTTASIQVIKIRFFYLFQMGFIILLLSYNYNVLQKMNEKELRKLRQKEAYLSLYWH
jgi:hypothetical protein